MSPLENIPAQAQLTNETNAGTSLIQTSEAEAKTKETMYSLSRTVELVDIKFTCATCTKNGYRHGHKRA